MLVVDSIIELLQEAVSTCLANDVFQVRKVRRTQVNGVPSGCVKYHIGAISGYVYV